MTRSLIKTIDIGPYSIKEYKKLKLEKYKENPGELEFLIGYIYNNICNDIVKILERRYYYIENDNVITDVHYHYTRRRNKMALHRKIRKFGVDRKGDKASTGEPVWICPPDKDVHDYNNQKRKEYYKIEKKLNLYLSDVNSEYKIFKEKKIKNITTIITKASGFKIFKVDEKLLNKIETNQSKEKPNKYKPPSLSNNESTTLVIKNIPPYIDRQVVYNSLKQIFIKYGGISKITVLNNKMDNSKLLGIAFIDFFNSKTINTILNINKKFAIESNILTLERQKKKKS